MRRCVIWGAADEYERIINQIRFEELKGNLQCVAVLSKRNARLLKSFDSYPVICKEELKTTAFDYLIIPGTKDYKSIKAEALALGVSNERVISGRVMKIPHFDFGRYASLRENPVTILSDDCWGGYVYHELDLPFSSPLINIYWPRDSFCAFIQDPLFYLEQPLVMARDSSIRGNLFPIGRLGEGERSVEMHFVHAANFQAAKDEWDRRKKRINPNRIFVKLGFNASEAKREEYLSAFSRVPYQKICTYSGETEAEDVFYSRIFERDWDYKKWLNTTNFNDWFREPENFFKTIDLLKLLNGEKDYTRGQDK